MRFWTALLAQIIVTAISQADFDSSDVRNPAFKIHLTKKGLNFISRIAKSMLIDFLKAGTANTIETKNSDGVSLKWNNLRVQKYNDDVQSNVVFSPGIGVEYRLQDLNLKLTSDYAVIQPASSKNQPTSGVLTVTMSGVSVALLIAMINSGGRMKPSLEDCRSTINNANLEINKGSPADLKKYFQDDAINSQAKSFLQQQICSFAKTIFLPQIEHNFANYPKTVNLFDDVYYNYSLTEDPDVNADNVVTSYAGNAYIKRNGHVDSRVPFQAPPVLEENYQDRMMCMFMSNYSLKSLIYFMSKQHRFDYNFTKTDTPSFAKYLRTECPSKEDMCAASVITSLPKQYPNSNLEIYIRQIPGREEVLIKKDLINMTGESYVNGYVRRPNGKKEWLFYSNIESYTTMKKPVFVAKNLSIETHLDANNFRLYNFSSISKDFNAESLSLLTGFAMDNWVTPDMKRTLGRGLRLPKLIEFDMANGIAAFEEGRIMIAADFCQTQDECENAEAAAKAENAKHAGPDYEIYGS